MGRNKLDLTQRRISIGVSLPYEIVTALSMYSDISGLARSVIIERAILLYLAQHKNTKKEEHDNGNT